MFVLHLLCYTFQVVIRLVVEPKYNVHLDNSTYLCTSLHIVCVCVCVCERERESERERGVQFFGMILVTASWYVKMSIHNKWILLIGQHFTHRKWYKHFHNNARYSSREWLQWTKYCPYLCISMWEWDSWNMDPEANNTFTFQSSFLIVLHAWEILHWTGN